MKTTDEKEGNASFKNSDDPTLVIRKLKGVCWGWPLSALTEWYFQPTLMLDDKGTRKQIQELVLAIGLRRVTVRGQNLERISDVLALGSGGELREQGAHFSKLAERTETFIEEILVEMGDDGMPDSGL